MSAGLPGEFEGDVREVQRKPQGGGCVRDTLSRCGGLRGSLCHDIFPNLCTFQFGWNLRWRQRDAIYLERPDTRNLVTLKLEWPRRAQA